MFNPSLEDAVQETDNIMIDFVSSADVDAVPGNFKTACTFRGRRNLAVVVFYKKHFQNIIISTTNLTCIIIPL